MAMVAGPHNTARIAKIISAAIAEADPDIRQFLKEALYIGAYNTNLSRELGKFVIRHRRQTDHRLFRVGIEYGVPDPAPALSAEMAYPPCGAWPGYPWRSGTTSVSSYALRFRNERR